MHLASKKAKHYSLSCHFKSYSWAKVDAEIPVIVFLWLPSTPNQMGGCWEARAFATTTLAWHSCSQTSSQQGANLPSSRTRASESELSSLAMFPSAKAKSRSVSSTCSFNNAWSATTLNSPSPGLPLSHQKELPAHSNAAGHFFHNPCAGSLVPCPTLVWQRPLMVCICAHPQETGMPSSCRSVPRLLKPCHCLTRRLGACTD